MHIHDDGTANIKERPPRRQRRAKTNEPQEVEHKQDGPARGEEKKEVAKGGETNTKAEG